MSGAEAQPLRSSDGPRRALVLSGGGARGAYEAGVLRYILEVLPQSLGHAPRLDIICGTSVGAINGAWLAATLDEPVYSARRMEELWRSLKFSRMVQLSYSELFRSFRRSILDPRMPRRLRSRVRNRSGGVLKTSFFDRLVGGEVPFQRIARNLKRGVLESVSVSATELFTGRTTVFVQSARPVPPWTRDPRQIAISGPLTLTQVMASAAIPVLFPAVRIDDHWYSDGGLRQNTPISPALRLGADRVLIIALRRRSLEERLEPSQTASLPEEHPNPAFVLGKLLDALLLDPLDYDLDVLFRINAILEYGDEAFHDGDFVSELNEVIRAHRGQGYRVVTPMLVRPGRDIGALAARFARAQGDDFWGSAPLRSLALRALENQGSRESDLLSYLLFDGGYTGELIDMGFHDAELLHDDLVEFFTD